MRRVAAGLLACSGIFFIESIEANDRAQSTRTTQMIVSVRLVSACGASVSTDGGTPPRDLDRLAQVSCPGNVPYRITVPGGTAGVPDDAQSASADGIALPYTISVEF